MTTNNDKPKRLDREEFENAQLLFLIDDSARNIGFAKTQQWRSIYYAILVYAALVGLVQLPALAQTGREGTPPSTSIALPRRD